LRGNGFAIVGNSLARQERIRQESSLTIDLMIRMISAARSELFRLPEMTEREAGIQGGHFPRGFGELE
jgi:hypothetical protein